MRQTSFCFSTALLEAHHIDPRTNKNIRISQENLMSAVQSHVGRSIPCLPEEETLVGDWSEQQQGLGGLQYDRSERRTRKLVPRVPSLNGWERGRALPIKWVRCSALVLSEAAERH